MHDPITGHTSGENAGQSYGRGFGLKVLAEAVARIEVPAVVRGLSQSERVKG